MFFRYDSYSIQDLVDSGKRSLSALNAGELTRGASMQTAARVIRDANYNSNSSNAAKMTVALLRAARLRSGGEFIYFTKAVSSIPATHNVIAQIEDYAIVISPQSGRAPAPHVIWSIPTWVSSLFVEDPTPATTPEGLVVERDSNLFIIRPSDELLETLPVNARNFATRVALATTVSSGTEVFEVTDENISLGRTTITSSVEPQGGYPDSQTLLTEARQSYREWLRLTMGRTAQDDGEIARQRAAREEAARRYSDFAARTPDTERHVPTLPFVPHGLSSSRRWGIEVESGGARGVAAPLDWRRISDGSLRSAWDGYVEVQDFEPHDEIVIDFTRPVNCPVNANRHSPEERFVNASGDYEYRANPHYINPADCEHCGNSERMVHVEPRTITHYAQGGDTGEFVSPILVSMHSNGLKELTDQLILQPQNDSAGVHVHVEASDLTNEEVATLIFGYDVLEPILEASYQREARRYCQRRSPQSALNAARMLRPGNVIDNDAVRGGDRYVTLNTTALNEHGTIEFRAMGPVYDYDYLVRWAMLCRELVNLAKAGVTTKQFSRIKKWEDLLMLLAEYGKEYVRAVTYELTGETGHAADLLKQGAEVTTEALNADLDTVLAGNLTVSVNTLREQWNLLSRVFDRNAPRVGDLVTVGNASTLGNYWMR